MARKYEFKPDKPRLGWLDKLVLTQKQRRSLLKWVLYALVLLVLSVLQDVLFSRMRIFGGTTELVPCGIFLICVLEGMERGTTFSLVASLVYLFSGSAAGAYCVVFITTLAALVTAFRQSYLQRGFAAAMLCTGVAMICYELVVFCIVWFLGYVRAANFFGFVVTALLTLPAAPILYPIFLAIGGGDVWND
ncbi:MAG: hypothetical protein J6Q54_03345 [Oscillospiraceae bacterium]|nr:hypothetical protein [Oscillospiraceae bacterium]